MHSTRIGLVVPTRDRPDKIVKLLESLEKSTVPLHEIVIVSFGVDISNSLERFKKTFPIKYHQSDRPGQVIQKKQAIQLLSPDLDWCIFTDDDLLFDPRAIENALATISTFGGDEVSGVGFALPSTSRSLRSNSVIRRIASVFGLAGKTFGQVLPSGQAISYLDAPNDLQTNWLNGVSMWRLGEAKKYGVGVPSARYAACEDLIFSYPISKTGKLVFSWKAKAYFQDQELTDFESVEVFRSAAYFRLYFVQSNNDLSSGRFLLAQFLRTTYASLKALKIKPFRIPKYWAVFFEVMFQTCLPRRTKRLITRLEEV